MKDYFKRLKEHSGLDLAIVMTIMGILAGASNKSAELLIGALFGLACSIIFVWLPILISNIKK